jgi:hypothetical protein
MLWKPGLRSREAFRRHRFSDLACAAEEIGGSQWVGADLGTRSNLGDTCISTGRGLFIDWRLLRKYYERPRPALKIAGAHFYRDVDRVTAAVRV